MNSSTVQCADIAIEVEGWRNGMCGVAQQVWTRRLGLRGVIGGVDLVVLVVVGEAHWIGSMDIMGWGWGWVAIVCKGL